MTFLSKLLHPQLAPLSLLAHLAVYSVLRLRLYLPIQYTVHLSNSPGVLLHDLLHLELVLAGQVEQVVHPVGGGGLEHGAPDQGAALGNHNKKVRMFVLNCQALVPSPVLIDPKPNPNQSKIKIQVQLGLG